MKIARASVFFPVLLVANLVSFGDWYCNECNEVHTSYCPKALFDVVDYDLSKAQIDLLGEIQTDIECLDVKSRVVVILRLMYTHDSNFWRLDFSSDKNIINWGDLKRFSWKLWQQILEKEGDFAKTPRYSDQKGALRDVENLESYLDDESHYEGSNTNGFKTRVRTFIKSIAQKCSMEDLDRVQKMLGNYKGSKYDTTQIIQIIKDVLMFPGCFVMYSMGHPSPISFIKIVRNVFAEQYVKAKKLHLCAEALQSPATDASTPEEIYDLLFRCKESEVQIAKIIGDIEHLLTLGENLSIMQIVEKLMGKYAFSLGAIAPCYFLCHWMGKHLDLEAYAKKLE